MNPGTHCEIKDISSNTGINDQSHVCTISKSDNSYIRFTFSSAAADFNASSWAIIFYGLNVRNSAGSDINFSVET